MGYVAAKCTQCGANIEVDSSNEASICSHCGAAFITDKAVDNFINTYNIQNATINLNVQNIDKMHIVHINQQDLWKNKINKRLLPLKQDIKYLKNPSSINVSCSAGCGVFTIGIFFILPIFNGVDALLIFGLLILVSFLIANHLDKSFSEVHKRVQEELKSIKSIDSNLEFEKMVNKQYAEFVEIIKKENNWK